MLMVVTLLLTVIANVVVARPLRAHESRRMPVRGIAPRANELEYTTLLPARPRQQP